MPSTRSHSNAAMRMQSRIFLAIRCHLERSGAKLKDPVKLPFGFATGFLDFARNDGLVRCLVNLRILLRNYTGN
ncbi:MAG: hypothetical protein DME52_12230 [Verrucomicrobia bacterium]|nr:MAG: hypothetical protein DME52_12230 [Verrucomicrobiota bacterium]